ncbi:unnamed protein product [Caenorhabditis nigoni]
MIIEKNDRHHLKHRHIRMSQRNISAYANQLVRIPIGSFIHTHMLTTTGITQVVRKLPERMIAAILPQAASSKITVTDQIAVWWISDHNKECTTSSDFLHLTVALYLMFVFSR